MPQIELIKAEPGMVLASDVTGPGDKILVTAGSVLSERHIETLKTRDISEVNVKQSSTKPRKNEIDPELLEIVKQRFRENDSDHPFINRLQQIYLEKVTNPDVST